MRVCMIYDCLYPYSIGGGERWYRNLAERLAAEGHEVTYVTMRQWDRGRGAQVPGVRVRAVAPRMALYVGGRRRIAPPLVFGLGVLWHLLRRGGDYDVVHTSAFPYFSLLAAAALRPLRGYRLVVDWLEVWTPDYWREYLGPLGGRIGMAVQRRCIRTRQRAFVLSHLHARRLRDEGLRGEGPRGEGPRDKGPRGEATVLAGLYAGPAQRPTPKPAEPVVVFAGRHIPEKRVGALVEAIACLRAEQPAGQQSGTALASGGEPPELRCDIYGDGPDRPEVERLVGLHGLGDVVSVHGFVAEGVVDRALEHALCMVLPSRREGYGLVVIEAAARGTPSVVVADPDNAATELVEDDHNGFIAASASPQDIAAAIRRVQAAGPALRERTADWFAVNARRLSLGSSLDLVARAYAELGPRR